MPMMWKVGMAVLVICLLASMVIAIVRLSTTPTEILGADFRGISQVDEGRNAPLRNRAPGGR